MVNRQQGVSDSTLYLQKQMPDYPYEARILSDEQRIYGMGSMAEMGRCLKAVDNIISEGASYSTLRERAQKLHATFKEIAAEFSVAAAQAKLPGPC